ncbi:hypothetical protein NP233_g11689 [Leucocoprinus birnbaumii]|uniref:Uncharacterized protein n=1 Tax=Leucocoprinus birnbaumii TaxID=56174 RepID=A0AAD5VJL9_9AGAR|nr:hypothetical protein NP233_g11689 [Leucocoprinus birnbaumii]
MIPSNQPLSHPQALQWTPHADPLLWFEVRYFIFSTKNSENRIFKVDASRLEKVSLVVRNVVAQHGLGTEVQPVHLHQVDEQEKKVLLRWLIRSDIDPPSFDRQALVMLLNASTALEVEGARAFGLQGLDNMNPPLSPAMRLDLACDYRVVEWVRIAVEALINSPISDLDGLDIDLMGWDAFAIIVKAREVLLRERAVIALSLVPQQVEHTCKDSKRCNEKRQVWWWQAVGNDFFIQQSP